MMKEHIMIRQQGFRAKFKSRQHGAVAIIVAICLVVLIGMLGLVLDLGHLYVTKTELQNAADAASLSGAKELNGKVTGINNAINRAIETAGRNKFNLHSTTLVISASNIRVGACPSAGCMVPISTITTDALAADKTFLEVNTGSHGLGTWFAQVLSSVNSNMATSAVAVAGKYEVDVAPVATCRLPSEPGVLSELVYERGVSYALKDTNPISPGTQYWIEPSTNEPGNCPNSNAQDTRPFMCTGKILFTPIIGGTVNTNTGISDNQREALDSRFIGSNYSASKCDPVATPPDRNVKEYFWNNPVNAGSPSDWIQTDPNRQSLQFVTQAVTGKWVPKPHALRSIADYGVLWSAYRPQNATVNQWFNLYGESATAKYPTPLDSYPGSSPYAQTSSSSNPEYYQENVNGVPGRRILNMVILDCENVVGLGCAKAPVLGIGKFFMQRRANKPAPSPDKDIYIEFGGLLPTPLPNSEIKLYR
jgi:Flp pilus assembly protein TadG